MFLWWIHFLTSWCNGLFATKGHVVHNPPHWRASLLFQHWGIQNKEKFWRLSHSFAVQHSGFCTCDRLLQRPIFERRDYLFFLCLRSVNDFLCFKSNIWHEISWNPNSISFPVFFFSCLKFTKQNGLIQSVKSIY